MKRLFLGVDTSNYTTSLALSGGGKIIKSVRKLLPVNEGEAGLRQSEVLFLHTKALPELAKELFSSVDFSEYSLCAASASAYPRNVMGSYMPCFLSGVSFASAVSTSHNIPFYRFSHQCGHIMAGIHSCGKNALLEDDFISFHVSGGTTEALYVKNKDGVFETEIIGGTTDASAGQIIDRAGLLLGLSFPCGKALDEISLDSREKIPVISSVKGGYFSLSGLQNKFEYYLSNGKSAPDCADFLFRSLARAIFKSLNNLRASYGEKPVLFVGGVMGNTVIRRELEALKDVYFASPELSS
ncbi:MAG: peptidase M22, partial [Clostridia bacterium]|nr:peptidase M22 [Clostridia bacterium]